MKHMTCCYRRLNIIKIKIGVLAIFVSIFFLPSYVPFEKLGNNMFTVILNNKEAGVVASPEEAEEYALEARRRIASDSEELVLVEGDLETVGSEVLWGKIDAPGQVIDNMVDIFRSDVKETLQRSYVVKINEYMVNLSRKDEVISLLQAALDKYDSESRYQVELHLDPARELSVLTTQIQNQEEVVEEVQETVNMEAGIHADLTEVFAAVEPAKEKDFEDYDLGLISMEYGDSIEVVEAYLNEDDLTPLGAAIQEVTQDEEKSDVYEVVSGDTLSEIAIKTNIPMDRLIEMNESLEDENSMIRVGDELVITVPEPKLAVVRQEEMYYEEDYEEEVIYVDNDDWYTTETKTLQEPSAGHRRVIAVVTFENDKKVNQEIVKEEITYQAVPKIVERGTKIPPTYIKPISGGRLTSRFGRRSRPTRGASTNHKGVDWATPTGTAVFASCGGTVAKAGWGSGYGYVVYINHPDGRQTRYGHLSKVLVSPGQTVSQGQKIALSGNTGISTGPHLHFEILINGSQVDPFAYMN
ncbi:MAG: M23 family metallopeptidase [Lachnospiraceae bacterium]|jgi:murein DD-endopeptidase MepM/ murein hydrolase activator NlpD|nr:M23 family metallopeptidase [Lachnospiraceae bacterium]GFI17919.1 murein DD-endopeptidase MepM [Lachnospiraceae bacterium]